MQEYPSILAIDEPVVCTYRITVCAPSVCVPAPSPTPLPTIKAGAGRHFFGLLWSAIISDGSKAMAWLTRLELATGPSMPLAFFLQ